MTEIVVASFNVHAGVDGWGRPYDVVAACRRIDADVLVLQEAWAPDDGTGTADEVAGALGYQVVSHPLARCRLLPADDAGLGAPSWGPRPATADRHRFGPALLAGDPDAIPAAGCRRSGAPVGTWGLALLSRVELARVEVVGLGQMGGDRARRAAIVADVGPGDAATPGGTLTVVGTHMSHLTDGSPVQLRRLARLVGPGTDTVVAGDMNLWGLPVSAMFPGLRRVVRGRTWPATRPLAQLDHILAGRNLSPHSSGEVMPAAGSDHRPVRARFLLPG